ncbi:MAG: serine/threonine-protein kinase, partial [Planctomycetota bacterium]
MAMVAEIADAVQHAHSRGVLHRDLKPANVMITDDNRAKVLDFGVARAADPATTEASIHTSAGQLIGTLPYMSPELVRGAPDDIDSRVDVYALGVILFELLTGRHPIDVSGMGVGEAAQAIEHTSPTRLTTLEPKQRGDIDVIVRTALAKDKERRYATASALADDIRRYLGGQTIAARPASAVYQLSRLARRHKPAVAVVAAATMTVIAATVITAVALVRERDTSERLIAENANFAAINEFLNDMLINANADEAGGNISLLDVLDSAAEEVESGSVSTSEVEASLRTTLGSTLGWLGYTDRAVALLEPAVVLNRELHGELHERTLTSLHLLARFQAREGDALQALDALGDTPGRLAASVGDDRDMLELLGNLYRVKAIALKRAGRNDEVEPVLTNAADVFERLRLPDGTYENGALGEVYNELGTLRRHQGKLEESREHYEQALSIYAQVHGDESERYSTVLNNLAIVYRTQGDYAKAIETMRRSVDITESIYGESSPGPVMVKLANLGNMHARRGHFTDAEAVLRRALAYHIEVLPEGHPN